MADLSLTSPIGYYVHHHGSGHMMRALTILRNIKHPVVLFSSREPYEPVPAHVAFVKLPDDSVEGYIMPSLGGTFLYNPYDACVIARYQLLIDTIRTHGIRAMYVDVSPEIIILCKLLGLHVGAAIMHGVRTDTAHTIAYDTADLLLSHNAKKFDTPTNRHTKGPVAYSGGITRLNKHASETPASIRSILVTTSRVGSSFSTAEIKASARLFPDITWNVIGATDDDLNGDDVPVNMTVHGIIENIVPLYDDADLVIGSGGNNTIMETAARRKPFLCIPDTKAFDEQTEAAKALVRQNAAFYEPAWPTNEKLSTIIAGYRSLDLNTFHSLVDDDAAAKAGRLIMSLLD